MKNCLISYNKRKAKALIKRKHNKLIRMKVLELIKLMKKLKNYYKSRNKRFKDSKDKIFT